MQHEVINQGAEAIISREDDKVVKRRISKSYRIKEIDEKVRKLRTRSEGKILEKAEKLIPIPRIIKVDEKEKEIVMEFIKGTRLSDCLEEFPAGKQEKICEETGESIAKLHEAGIIHGDLTPANMILDEKTGKVFFVDFGLGFISIKLEDKAVDLHLLKEALEAGFASEWERLFNAVKKGYTKSYSESEKVLERLEAVEKRGRYKQGS